MPALQEAHEDLPADLVETATELTLLAFAELLHFVDAERLAPNWSALVVRVLLLRGEVRAREIFRTGERKE